MPLLTGSVYLEIPQDRIFTKQYLAPTILDKSAEKTFGYFPDYSVWMYGFPVLIVEAKAPDVSSESGYREATPFPLVEDLRTDGPRREGVRFAAQHRRAPLTAAGRSERTPLPRGKGAE